MAGCVERAGWVSLKGVEEILMCFPLYVRKITKFICPPYLGEQV